MLNIIIILFWAYVNNLFKQKNTQFKFLYKLCICQCSEILIYHTVLKIMFPLIFPLPLLNPASLPVPGPCPKGPVPSPNGIESTFFTPITHEYGHIRFFQLHIPFRHLVHTGFLQLQEHLFPVYLSLHQYYHLHP